MCDGMRRINLSLAVFFALIFSFPILAADPDGQKVFTDQDLAHIASNKYDNGELPLGDKHYVLDAPRKGYIYMCGIPPSGGGAEHAGTWLHDTSWNEKQKPTVQGDVYWKEASFNHTVNGTQRILSGNGLPVAFPTGHFPISPSDLAAQYDRNPNRIQEQNLNEALPLHPVYSDTPYCMGMQVGVMLNGVSLFNGLDADLRDAAAHEIQDLCGGHPERNGRYHYHGLSACLRKSSIKTVIGYALDGFPITGPMVTDHTYLTTDDLDECHGMTSAIVQDGKETISYHYVMTYDFPYSVSCFRSKPLETNPMRNGSQTNIMPNTGGGTTHQPPAEALSACKDKTDGSDCEFTSPRGDDISGTCHAPPGVNALGCMPLR